jgi:hypothetical protein
MKQKSSHVYYIARFWEDCGIDYFWDGPFKTIKEVRK